VTRSLSLTRCTARLSELGLLSRLATGATHIIMAVNLGKRPRITHYHDYSVDIDITPSPIDSTYIWFAESPWSYFDRLVSSGEVKSH
jgi:hypothetical protein